MIRNILDLLEVVNSGNETIQFAKGKHYLPENFKGVYKQIKTEIKWLKNT